MLVSRCTVAGCKWNPAEEVHVPLYRTRREVGKSGCFRRPSCLCFLSVLQLPPAEISDLTSGYQRSASLPEEDHRCCSITEQSAQPAALRAVTDLLLPARAKAQSSLLSQTLCMIHSPYADTGHELCFMTLCSSTQVTSTPLLAPQQTHSSEFK